MLTTAKKILNTDFLWITTPYKHLKVAKNITNLHKKFCDFPPCNLLKYTFGWSSNFDFCFVIYLIPDYPTKLVLEVVKSGWGSTKSRLERDKTDDRIWKKRNYMNIIILLISKKNFNVKSIFFGVTCPTWLSLLFSWFFLPSSGPPFPSSF